MMDIADVAKASGLPASTLRYYEEKGLIQSDGRKGLRRLFARNVIQRLALISLGRGAGFSLDEIGKMFTSPGPTITSSTITGSGITGAGIKGPAINRELLVAKADELDKKIKELTAMRDGLRHAAACKAKNHFECPKFLRLLRIAGKNRVRPPNELKTNKFKSPQNK